MHKLAALGLTSETLFMRKILILAVAATALAVSACNTVTGIARDAQAAGQAVENCAQGRC